MKRILAVLIGAILVMALAACAAELPETSAKIANPWVIAESAEEVEKQTGIAMAALPEEVESVSYSVGDGKIAQAVFMWQGDEYTFRMARGAQEGLAGMYVDFESTEEAAEGELSYTISYTDGQEGMSSWYDETGDMSYTVTMDAGATKEKLTKVSNILFAQN